MENLSFLPVLLPLLAGVILLMPQFGKTKTNRRVTSVFLSIITFIVSLALLVKVQQDGSLVYAIGNWSAPFGIVLVADALSTLLVCLTALLGLVCVLYAPYQPYLVYLIHHIKYPKQLKTRQSQQDS